MVGLFSRSENGREHWLVAYIEINVRRQELSSLNYTKKSERVRSITTERSDTFGGEIGRAHV